MYISDVFLVIMRSIGGCASPPNAAVSIPVCFSEKAVLMTSVTGIFLRDAAIMM